MMPQVLVRNVDAEVLTELKRQAQTNDRSLEAELRVILQEAVTRHKTRGPVQAEVERLRAVFAGRVFNDSAELLRQDRER